MENKSKETLKEYLEKIEIIDKALKIDSKNSEALSGKAFCLNEIGRYQEALVVINEALKIDPNTINKKIETAILYNIAQKNSENSFNIFAMFFGGIPILFGIYGLITNGEQWFSYLLIFGGAFVWWWLAKQ